MPAVARLSVIGGSNGMPDPELCDLLAELLADAQAGRLVALVGVTTYANGDAFDLEAGAHCPVASAGYLLALAMALATEPE